MIWCLWSVPLHEGFRNRPYCLRCDLTVPYFSPHRSSAFLWVILLMFFLTQLAAILHAGSWVSLHSFSSLCLPFNRRSNPGTLWFFVSENETLLVSSLYAETIEAVKSRTSLSASSSELNQRQGFETIPSL
jgi:hypothetical protein